MSTNIRFVCTINGLQLSLNNYRDGNDEQYETLYFLDDNVTAYNTCNATSMKVFSHKIAIQG